MVRCEESVGSGAPGAMALALVWTLLSQGLQLEVENPLQRQSCQNRTWSARPGGLNFSEHCARAGEI